MNLTPSVRLRPMFLLPLLLCAGFAGCSEDHDHDHGESPEEEACEHLTQGPFQQVTAGATTDTTLPNAAIEHTSVGIALNVRDDGQYEGAVSFGADDATEFLLMLDTDVPLQIFDRDGVEVAIESSVSGQSFCDELAIVHRVDLEVGTYTLAFGPTAATTVSLVYEEDGAHHSE